MREVHQPRPFDFDEPRPRPSLTGYEVCEALFMASIGKNFDTMTADDLAALKIACPLYAGHEHQEKRR